MRDVREFTLFLNCRSGLDFARLFSAGSSPRLWELALERSLPADYAFLLNSEINSVLTNRARKTLEFCPKSADLAFNQGTYQGF